MATNRFNDHGSPEFQPHPSRITQTKLYRDLTRLVANAEDMVLELDSLAKALEVCPDCLNPLAGTDAPDELRGLRWAMNNALSFFHGEL